MRVADLFCGAGGMSEGARQAFAEARVRMNLVCVNHWPVAIDTHTANHPDAIHYCDGIENVEPLIATRGQRLDLLMGAPTCVYYSRARGGRPTSDQQRSQPSELVTWIEQTKARLVIVENVPEIIDWGPVDPVTGRPVKARKGEFFRKWLNDMRAAGMRSIEYRIINCADYGDATARQRFILIGRADGLPVDWPAPTHAAWPHNLLEGLPRHRGADEIVDLGHRGTSIFTRKRPLAAATLQRISRGLLKCGEGAAPYLVVLRRHADSRGIDLPIPTVTAGGNHLALAQPMITKYYSAAKTAKPLHEPLDALTTKARFALIQPVYEALAAGHLPDDERVLEIDGERYRFDILFRMLTAREMAAAHSFPAGYHFAGTGTDHTRQVGNSVPVRTARALVSAQLPALGIGDCDIREAA